jgi:hypothetical protein
LGTVLPLDEKQDYGIVEYEKGTGNDLRDVISTGHSRVIGLGRGIVASNRETIDGFDVVD